MCLDCDAIPVLVPHYGSRSHWERETGRQYDSRIQKRLREADFQDRCPQTICDCASLGPIELRRWARAWAWAWCDIYTVLMISLLLCTDDAYFYYIWCDESLLCVLAEIFYVQNTSTGMIVQGSTAPIRATHEVLSLMPCSEWCAYHKYMISLMMMCMFDNCDGEPSWWCWSWWLWWWW